MAVPAAERWITEDRALAHDIARTSPRYIEAVVEIVAAYVSRNHVVADDVPALIASVHGAISQLASGERRAAAPLELKDKPSPAQIKRSVQPDAIISFIDDRPYKTLKRHLKKHGFDPQSYRERFGLPDDYPMISASYSERRSDLARASGLGILARRGQQGVSTKQPSKGQR